MKIQDYTIFANFKQELEKKEEEMIKKMSTMERYLYLCFNDCESYLQIYGVITNDDMTKIVKKNYNKCFKE